MDRLKPSGCAWVHGSGGQDDRSPVTRICRAPDYAESTVGVGIIPWWRRWSWLGARHIQMASRKASRASGGLVAAGRC